MTVSFLGKGVKPVTLNSSAATVLNPWVFRALKPLFQSVSSLLPAPDPYNSLYSSWPSLVLPHSLLLTPSLPDCPLCPMPPLSEDRHVPTDKLAHLAHLANSPWFVKLGLPSPPSIYLALSSLSRLLPEVVKSSANKQKPLFGHKLSIDLK